MSQIAFSYMVVRYDSGDYHSAVAVCYATCYQQAVVLLKVLIDHASLYDPAALYAVREYVPSVVRLS